MPGMCMGMALEMQLEQRLTQMMLQQVSMLSGEEGLHEQFKLLEIILEDIQKGVYSDVNNFSYRVMKRIKKKNRTPYVKKCIVSLRELIANSADISLRTVSNIVDLGISSTLQADYAHKVFNSLTHLSQEVQPLDALVLTGRQIVAEYIHPSSFYKAVLEVNCKTKGEMSAQEGYDQMRSFIESYAGRRRDIVDVFSEIMGKKRFYGRLHVAALFRIIDQTCRLAVPDDLTYSKIPVSEFIESKDLEKMLKEYPHVPLPILAEMHLQKLSNKGKERMNAFAKTKHLRRSKDNQRAILSAMINLRNYRFSRRVIEDVFCKASGARQARDILSRFAGLARFGKVRYDFNLPDGDSILEHLKRRSEFSHPLLNQISDEALNEFRNVLQSNSPKKHVFSYNPILQLGEIYARSYPDGIPLLSEILEAIILDKFHEFRYSDMSQLGSCSDEWQAWIQNDSKMRLPGDLEGLEPQYRAVMKIVEWLDRKYVKVYGEKLSAENVSKLDDRLAALKERVHEKAVMNAGAKGLVDEMHIVYNRAIYARIINSLKDLKVEQLPGLQSIISGCLTKYSDDNFRQGITDISLIATDVVLKNERIMVLDTDDPDVMFNVGCVPIKSCQRWTEKTGYNSCLLAYVADPNKKVFQVLDDRGKVRLRSIVRVMHPEHFDSSLLFIERPYANRLSDDLLTALVGAVLDKAYRISKDTGWSVCVGAADGEYRSILERMADDGSLDYTAEEVYATFHSRNGREYSDAFGGVVKNGDRKCTNIGYICISAEK